jgi:hypothetical protein
MQVELGSILTVIPQRYTVRSSKLPIGKWVIASWDCPNRRDWYGCPPGKVIGYDDTLRLYTVEHYDCEVPYSLYYSRTELTASWWERLIFKIKERHQKIK